MRFTKWRAGRVVTDEGTASAAFARWVTIETGAGGTVEELQPGLVSPIVTQRVLVVEATRRHRDGDDLAARAVCVLSGTTLAAWPTDGISSTDTDDVTS
jgi:hypothetical protein